MSMALTPPTAGATVPAVTTSKRGGHGTRRLVLKYHLMGLGPTEIAKLAGISRQAVHGHLDRLRESGELKEEKSA